MNGALLPSAQMVVETMADTPYRTRVFRQPHQSGCFVSPTAERGTFTGLARAVPFVEINRTFARVTEGDSAVGQPAPQQTRPRIHVVLNWFDELRAKVPR
jgi:hypothetical protein